jgi:hypothetical protein
VEGSSSAQASNSAEGSNGSRNSSAEGKSETRSERSDSHGHNAERYNAEDWHRDWDRHHGHYYDGRYYLYEDGYWYGTEYGCSYDYDSGSDSDSSADADSNSSNSNGSKSNTNYDVGSTYTVTPDPTVLAVQTRLTHLGYYSGPVDGIYGPTTRDAVANYQIAANLTVTGTLSAETLKLLALPQVTQR